MSFSKKFVSSFLRDSVSARPVSIVRLFESPAPERVDPKGEALPSPYVKVHHLPYETYTAININPYTLEEQLMLYPIVAVNNMPLSVVVHQPQKNHIVIDVE